MPIIGLNQGVQPLVSFNFGAEKYDRVKKAIKLAMIAATVIVTFGFIITRLFPKQLVSMFNQDPELLAFGDMAIYSWFLMLPLVGFQIIGANFFQAIGRSKSAMFLTLTRQIIFLIPAVLLFPRIWGIQGLLYAAPFADVLSTLLTGTFFFMVMKDLTKLHHNTNQEPLIETVIEL